MGFSFKAWALVHWTFEFEASGHLQLISTPKLRFLWELELHSAPSPAIV